MSSIPQHNEVMDTQPKLTFAPHRHHLLLVCLCISPAHILSHALLAMPILLIHFMPLHMLLASFPSIACLLVYCLYLCMYAYGASTLGARAQSPKCKRKGCRCKHVDMSQAATISRYRSLAYPFGYVLFKKPPLFVLPFSLRWFVLGISCCVLFVLISRVWRPLFIFLHLYFGPCSRDVDIYFPTLYACIVHDVCIYILACPLLV